MTSAKGLAPVSRAPIHKLSKLATSRSPAIPPKGAPGLYHIAFRIGSSREELAAARQAMDRHGLTPFGDAEGPAPCFCVKDPDGHTIELYVDQKA